MANEAIPSTPASSSRLVHEFTYHAACDASHEVGVGPFGMRQYYAMTEGKVTGPRVNGRLLGQGGDWMLLSPDGFMRMDVRIQIETNDAAVICAHYFGPAEANAKLNKAVRECKETSFTDQSIRTHWVLETGAPQYAWVNQAVFVGEGRLLPMKPGVLGFEHRIFRVA